MNEKMIEKIGTCSDKYNESGVDYYRIPCFDEEGNKVMIKQVLEEFFRPYHCSHEHDCCGCVFTHYGDCIGKDKIHDHYIVSQAWGRNI